MITSVSRRGGCMAISKSEPRHSRATVEQLQELHGLIADIMLTYLKETPSGQHTAFMLNVIRSFLVDNGIKKDLVMGADVRLSLKELTDMDLPFLPDASFN